MEFGLFNSGDDSEYNGVNFVEIPRIFAMQNVFVSLDQNQLTEYTCVEDHL